MRARYRTAAYVAISAFILISVPAVAAITERVKQDCRGDYQRYCSEYAVGSEALPPIEDAPGSYVRVRA